MLADHLALGVVALDPDIVEIDRAMHAGAGIGLGDHQRHGLAREAPDGRRQAREAGRVGAGAGQSLAAQQAQGRIRHPAQLVALLVLDQLVAAIAEEGEVVVGDPFEEGARLGQLVRIDLACPIEIGERVLDPAEHRLPVLHRGPDIRERHFEGAPDLLQPLRIALPVDLDMHERFGALGAIGGGCGDRLDLALGIAPDRHDRVDRQMDHQAQPVERHADRIDQERHVVIDDLDHTVGRLPAMLLDMRVVDPDPRLADPALLAEAQMGERCAIEIQGIAIDQIARRHGAVVMLQEDLGLAGLRRRHHAVHAQGDFPQQLVLLFLQPRGHGGSLRAVVERPQEHSPGTTLDGRSYLTMINHW